VLDAEDSHFNDARSVLLPDLKTDDPELDERRITGLGVIFAAYVHAAKHEGQGLFVTGHTDPSGKASYNQRLSEKRAENVSLPVTGVAANRPPGTYVVRVSCRRGQGPAGYISGDLFAVAIGP